VKRATALLAALALDALAGDPRWLPHPVRGMGRLAQALEAPARRRWGDTRGAGAHAVLGVLTATLSAVFLARAAARRLHPAAGALTEVTLLWWALAPRDLADHALRVQRALQAGDLERARERVAWMVGRDTAALDEEGVVRAAAESVAENTLDGVAAPLCYAALGGAPLAMAYKAASTLDSTFGYRDARYRTFGWAAARLDDAAAYVPARVLPVFVVAAAALRGERARQAWRVCRRDGGRHTSPNAGLAEAAFAGALGVRFGGPLYRGGEAVPAPFIGIAREPLRPEVISRAVSLMYTSGVLLAGTLCALLWLVDRGRLERRARAVRALARR
jgi:adenosylcobinamide-phosphate synthase